MVTSEQRRRQLAREKYERQMENRVAAEKARKKRNAIVAGSVVLVAAAVVGLITSGVFDSSPAKPSTDAAGATCNPAQTSPKHFAAEPKVCVDTKANYTMSLDMTGGKVTVALDAAKAPHTVNSFNFLAGKQYFDGTKCHRLTTQGIYVLQCGDPTGTGSGGPGYQFPDENLTGATYPAGTVAMANAGPGTNGSQFFLVYKDTQLPPSYTPFGKITGGMDVIQKIADAGVQGGGGDGAPATPVTLNKVTVAKS